MSFQIKEMDSLSGTKAHIYSVLFDGDDDTLIEQFFNENEGNEHLTEMLRRIITMAMIQVVADSSSEKGKEDLVMA